MAVIVPVRGMSCIRSPPARKGRQIDGYRPREGYELHPEALLRIFSQSEGGYRPREGYELHPRIRYYKISDFEALSSP